MAMRPIRVLHNSMRLVNRPLDLAWLEDFLSLSDSGSFSRTAQQRHLAQPALSRHIHSLEEWIGVALFDRSTHPVSLTEAGRRFRPMAEDLLHRLARAREEAQAAEEAVAKTLRFAATHALSLTFFPAWLRSLESRVHMEAIHLVSDILQACEESMLQGRVQFLLCHYHWEVANRLPPTDFHSILIGTDTLVPVTAPDETGQPRLALSGQRDSSLPVLVYSAESGLGRIIRTLRRRLLDEARLEPVFTAHLAVVLKTMALDGRGIAWLPRNLIRDELEGQRLVEAGTGDWHIPVEIRLFRHHAQQAPAAEAFWQVVEAGQS